MTERTQYGVQICGHCGDRVSGKAQYDDKCSTVEKRKALDRAENENWQLHFKKDYPCKMSCLGG